MIDPPVIIELKLSKAQARLINLMMKNPDCAMHTSPFYNHQDLIKENGKFIGMFKKTTVNVLIDREILVPHHPGSDKYSLNEKLLTFAHQFNSVIVK
jgi:hypothetical protein